jgi:hypothetical protein
LVVTTIVLVFIVGTMGIACVVARVGLVVGHVAGSPGVPRSTSICWDTGSFVTGMPSVAF